MLTAIFTYGTLKKGYRNNGLLRTSKFVGEAQTMPIYRLYDCGAYPCMILDEKNGVSVSGEVWIADADVLSRLDLLEGVPHLYQRCELKLKESPIIPAKVQGYLYQRSIKNFADCGTSWPR